VADSALFVSFFFFQAEDGIRDFHVTGVQTCALPIVITWCVIHRKTVVAGTVGLLVLSAVGMATVVEKQFFPESDRPEVLVSVFMPQGTSIGVTDQTVQQLEATTEAMEEVGTMSAAVQ